MRVLYSEKGKRDLLIQGVAVALAFYKYGPGLVEGATRLVWGLSDKEIERLLVSKLKNHDLNLLKAICDKKGIEITPSLHS